MWRRDSCSSSPLFTLTTVRLLRFPARLFADMVDHARGPGFFTLIAGSRIVGSALVTIVGAYRPAVALRLSGKWGLLPI